MAKKLVISKCQDCPHKGSVLRPMRPREGAAHRGQVSVCRKSNSRPLVTANTIPEWCPLEDEHPLVYSIDDGHPLLLYSIDDGVDPRDTELETESPVADTHRVYRPAACPFCSVTPGVHVRVDEFVDHPEGSCVYGGRVFPKNHWPQANNDTHCSYPVCRCTLGEDKVCPRGLPDLEYKSAAVPRALY